MKKIIITIIIGVALYLNAGQGLAGSFDNLVSSRSDYINNIE